MLSLNRATIIGNLTRDPELRYTANGQAVTSFSVATNRAWNDAQGEKQEAVEYHNVVTWGKLAEICNQLLVKGRKVYIEGRLQTRQWEGQDGAKRERTEIVAENMLVLDKRESGSYHPTAAPAASAPTFSASDSSQQAPMSADASVGGESGLPKDSSEKKEVNIDDIPF